MLEAELKELKEDYSMSQSKLGALQDEHKKLKVDHREALKKIAVLEIQVETRHIGTQRTIGYDAFKPPEMINNNLSESEDKQTVDDEAEDDGQSTFSKAAEFQNT